MQASVTGRLPGMLLILFPHSAFAASSEKHASLSPNIECMGHLITMVVFRRRDPPTLTIIMIRVNVFFAVQHGPGNLLTRA